MSNKTKLLPYFNIQQDFSEREAADFFFTKFRHSFKKQSPLNTINNIKKHSKSHPYFLRFDIMLFFPSINHEVLLKKLPEIFTKMSRKEPSRNFKKHLKTLPSFLKKSPYQQGLPIGSKLSFVLCNAFLLDLDLEISVPFLKHTDDYLLFFKKKHEPEEFLQHILLPKLQELKLELNFKKLKSGRFHRDKVAFLGFDFYSGYFTVSEEKVNLFKERIKKITYLTNKKDVKAIVKTLNNKILGFGHYYKFCSSKKTFQDLDSFIRMRLRRYISRNREQRNKTGNLILTNEFLEKINLKSLTKIHGGVLRRKVEKKKKTVKTFLNNYEVLETKGHLYEQKAILENLKELAKIAKNIEKRLKVLEKKKC